MTFRIGHKYKIMLVVLFTILIGILIAVGYENFLDKNNLRDLEQFRYDIVDRGAIDSEISKWVDKNLKKSGVYNTTDDNYTYILISSGTQNKEGTNITLYSVIQKYSNINVTYSINKNLEGEIVEDYESAIILRGTVGKYNVVGTNKKS